MQTHVQLAPQAARCLYTRLMLAHRIEYSDLNGLVKSNPETLGKFELHVCIETGVNTVKSLAIKPFVITGRIS